MAILLKLILGDVPFKIWLKEIDVNVNDAVLDVGSGVGVLLQHMNLAGFSNLTGIDPFINETINYSNQLKIIKGNLRDLIKDGQKFNLILYNYSFEHLAEPLEYLIDTRKLQNKGDNLILRIPVHNSYAWRKFGVNWGNLDAPRHFHILSEQSVELLAEKSGYKINKVIYDSTDFQFWLSILYENNIPFTATKFGSKRPMKNFRYLVSKNDEIEFKKLAEELNANKDGDQATFYLKAK